jgi:hypothetical protein
MDAPLLESERIHKVTFFIEFNPEDQWTILGFGRTSHANSQEKVHLWTTNATPEDSQKWTYRRFSDRKFHVENGVLMAENKRTTLRFVPPSSQENDLQCISLGEEFQGSYRKIMGNDLWDVIFEGEESTRKYLESLSPERLQVEINKYGPIDTIWEDLTPLIWAARLVSIKYIITNSVHNGDCLFVRVI